MKDSPYRGKVPTLDDTFQMYQILKFYYPELDTLALGAVAEIMRNEFDCKCTEFDVYLYLSTLLMRDENGNYQYDNV